MRHATYEAPMDAGTAEPKPPEAAKKPPRKPRPSEIAAKKAREAAKKAAAKPKAKPAPKKKAKTAKPKTSAGPLRSERLELRLTKAEKAKLRAASKRSGIPVAGVIQGLLAKLK